VWYSEHRGRLWIASTAKEPHPEEIKELENFYKKYYNGMLIFYEQKHSIIIAIYLYFLKMKIFNSQSIILLAVC